MNKLFLVLSSLLLAIVCKSGAITVDHARSKILLQGLRDRYHQGTNNVELPEDLELPEGLKHPDFFERSAMPNPGDGDGGSGAGKYDAIITTGNAFIQEIVDAFENLDSEVEDLKEGQSELRQDVDDLTVEVEQLKTDVADLTNRMDQAETDIDELESDVADLDNRLDVVEADIDQLELRQEQLTERVEQLEMCTLDTCEVKENWENGMVNLDGTTVITVTRPVVDLDALTACFWMRSTDDNEGAPLSYMQLDKKNSFLISNYKDFHILINDKEAHAHVSANDGQWHHICATWDSSNGNWAIYKDGAVENSGTKFQKGKRVKGGGFMTIGQQQNNVAGKFDEHKAFIGDIAHVNVWNYVVTSDEIQRISGECTGQPEGNVFSWSPLDVYITAPDVIESADICSDKK